MSDIIDSLLKAGGSRELGEQAKSSVTAASKERFLRTLIQKGVGTRVIEDKAGGLVLEAINARGGLRTWTPLGPTT